MIYIYTYILYIQVEKGLSIASFFRSHHRIEPVLDGVKDPKAEARLRKLTENRPDFAEAWRRESKAQAADSDSETAIHARFRAWICTWALFEVIEDEEIDVESSTCGRAAHGGLETACRSLIQS